MNIYEELTARVRDLEDALASLRSDLLLAQGTLDTRPRGNASTVPDAILADPDLDEPAQRLLLSIHREMVS